MNALHTQREKRGEKQQQQQQQWGGREAWYLLDKAYLRDTQWTSEAASAVLIVHLAYLTPKFARKYFL